MTVVLLDGEYRRAAAEKPAWQARKAIERNERRSFQYERDPDIIGAKGEAALCQFLGVDPFREMFKDDPSLPDVCGIEVKSTRQPGYRLLISTARPVRSPHVLAIADYDSDRVRLVGWIEAASINDDRRFPFSKDRRGKPAKFIAQADLDPDLEPLRRYAS